MLDVAVLLELELEQAADGAPAFALATLVLAIKAATLEEDEEDEEEEEVVEEKGEKKGAWPF